MPDQSQNPPAANPFQSQGAGEDKPKDFKSDAAIILEKVEKLTQQTEVTKLEIEVAKKEIDDGKKAIVEGKATAKETKDLVVFGFLVLLVMVGLSIIQSWEERANSYNHLIEKIDSLQTQLKLQEQSDSY